MTTIPQPLYVVEWSKPGHPVPAGSRVLDTRTGRKGTVIIASSKPADTATTPNADWFVHRTLVKYDDTGLCGGPMPDELEILPEPPFPVTDDFR